jgi:hypothetical protein
MEVLRFSYTFEVEARSEVARNLANSRPGRTDTRRSMEFIGLMKRRLDEAIGQISDLAFDGNSSLEGPSIASTDQPEISN